MKNLFIRIIPLTTAWLVIVLFIYTASDKLLNLADFAEFLGRLEYLGPYASLLAWIIPLAEIGISLMLLLPERRYAGLCMALGLMLAFTVYLVYMRITRSELPCHCGGVISKLSWLQHIWFNMGLIVLLLFSAGWFLGTRPAD